MPVSINQRCTEREVAALCTQATPTVCPSADQLRRSLDPDGFMTEEERSRIEAHVDQCEKGCKQAIAAFLDTNAVSLGRCDTPPVCRGEPFSAASRDESIPSRLGRYQIVARLGAGGMGVVYRGHDPQLGRDVAVKMPIFRGSEAAQSALRVRFLREAHSAAAVRHANVCPIYDIGEEDGRPFVVMPLVEGGSLADRLQSQGPFADPRAAVAMIVKVADALSSVHDAQIVHRDLKPGNILLDRWGEPYLTDFGLARCLESQHITLAGQMVGTPAFMAPEQAHPEFGVVGPHSDQYSLGVVLYQMLTGRLPFEGKPEDIILQIQSKQVRSPSQHRSDLDPRLERVLLRSLAREPQQRYRSVVEFADALRDWHGPAGTDVARKNSADAERLSRPRAPFRLTRRAALGTLLAAAAGGVLWWPPRPDLSAAQERFEQELQALRAAKPIVLKSRRPGWETVPSLSYPDYSSFVFLNDERIWDLRGFRQRGPDDPPMTCSAGLVRYLRAAKVAEAREIRLEGRTSGTEIFLHCPSHADRCKEYVAESKGQVGDQLLKVRQIAVDVSDVPVGETMNVQLNQTTWDSLQTPADCWLGMVDTGSPNLRMTILFPDDRPLKSYALELSPLRSRELPVPFRGESAFLIDRSRTAIRWEIRKPVANQIYRFAWTW